MCFDVAVANGINGDAVTVVVARSASFHGPDQDARAVVFGDENVVAAGACQHGLIPPDLGECEGAGEIAGYIAVPGGIGGDALTDRGAPSAGALGPGELLAEGRARGQNKKLQVLEHPLILLRP
jgi:hypothetical protein